MLQNAIVIMFDSLQFNYLGCYGNDWIKTPNFDRVAREGVVFENCYIEGLPTVPCRRAMHTGRYTLHKGGWVPLTMEDTMISDLCWGRPIDTALIFDCPMYRLPKFGYTRGFDKVWYTHGHEADHYFYAQDPLYHEDPNDYLEEHFIRDIDKLKGEEVLGPLQHELGCYLRQSQYWRDEKDRYVSRTVTKAVSYLEQVDRNKQFYLWIDSFDPHEPWNPPSVYMKTPCPYDPDYKGKDMFLPILGEVKDVYTEPEMHHIRMLYAELVSLCDQYLGVLIDAIRRLGFEQNTLLMVVSDHGEPLGNGEHGHGIMRKCRPWPYEELVHAPMLLRGPGVKAGQRIKAFVQSVDVAPTVCDWLGIGVHPSMHGKSLLPLVHGEVEKLRDFAVSGYCKYSWSIINHDYSYIHWLQPESNERSNTEYVLTFFASEMEKASANMATETGDMMTEMANTMMPEKERDALAQHQQAASLDGEEQWTCTPGSIAEVPAKDELYDRKTDPFQLKNIIDKKPDIARDMLKTLRTFMSELRAS